MKSGWCDIMCSTKIKHDVLTMIRNAKGIEHISQVDALDIGYKRVKGTVAFELYFDTFAHARELAKLVHGKYTGTGNLAPMQRVY